MVPSAGFDAPVARHRVAAVGVALGALEQRHEVQVGQPELLEVRDAVAHALRGRRRSGRRSRRRRASASTGTSRGRARADRRAPSIRADVRSRMPQPRRRPPRAARARRRARRTAPRTADAAWGSARRSAGEMRIDRPAVRRPEWTSSMSRRQSALSLRLTLLGAPRSMVITIGLTTATTTQTGGRNETHPDGARAPTISIVLRTSTRCCSNRAIGPVRPAGPSLLRPRRRAAAARPQRPVIPPLSVCRQRARDPGAAGWSRRCRRRTRT